MTSVPSLATFRPMDEREVKIARALCPAQVTYSVASFDKRFARDLAGQASQPDPQITEKQARLMLVKLNRYRRQVRADDLAPEDRWLLKTGALDRLVMVCSSCLKSGCARGAFHALCSFARGGAKHQSTVRELIQLGAEHRDNFSPEASCA